MTIVERLLPWLCHEVKSTCCFNVALRRLPVQTTISLHLLQVDLRCHFWLFDRRLHFFERNLAVESVGVCDLLFRAFLAVGECATVGHVAVRLLLSLDLDHHWVALTYATEKLLFRRWVHLELTAGSLNNF